jgi:hypothetical protein
MDTTVKNIEFMITVYIAFDDDHHTHTLFFTQKKGEYTMLITKEIRNRLVLSDIISFIRKTDNRYYMICEDHAFQRKGVKIQKEFLIETVSNHDALYQRFYVSISDHIRTIISLLKLNDNITLRLRDCNYCVDSPTLPCEIAKNNLLDDLTVIEIFLDVERPTKQGIVKYSFLIKTVVEKYL